MDYIQKLKRALESSQSCLCVGLDPNIDKIPEPLKIKHSSDTGLVTAFLKGVIELTSEYCAAYKPNLGFFEALGPEGLRVFNDIIEYIPDDKIIIADAKRGDISSTAEHYAKAYFETFNTDAVTINPLMGFESLEPFMQYPGKGIYTLTLTSNPGARDFLIQPFGDRKYLAAYIASRLRPLQSGSETHLGMVIGATNTEFLSEVISAHPEGALLIPGIGAQGGSITGLLNSLKTHPGIPLVSSSRSILYAGENQSDWEKEVAKKAKEFKAMLKPITEQYV